METKSTRVEQFTKDYLELVKKHDVDFVAYPAFSPTPNGGFEIRCMIHPVDKGTLSPMQKEDIIKK